MDAFIGNARNVAALRDSLHIARGGSFVVAGQCPDGCDVELCSHVGEPLNSSGKRERISGPASRRVSSKVSFGANFGGLVRMVKVRGEAARAALENGRAASTDAANYLDFIRRIGVLG
ncbi:MAG: hypothetical protein RLZ55_1174 [Actinomycetota bacterium]